MANIRARLAHMGIYVHDRDRMEQFYTEVLGLMVTDQGQGRAGMHLTFMSGNSDNHHQMVLVTGRPDTSGFNPIQQISFMVDSLADLREVHGAPWRLARPRCGRSVTATPGRSTSRIRKATRSRPISTPRSMCRSHMAKRSTWPSPDEQILRETEEACRADPGFMPIEQFKQEMAARLGAGA